MRTMVLVPFATLLAMTARAESVAAPPLSANDSWTYQHTVETRAGGWRQTRVESTVLRAEPTSIITSSHIAGTFHALKLGGEGQWSAAIAPAIGARIDA